MSLPFEGFCCTGCGNVRSSPAGYRGGVHEGNQLRASRLQHISKTTCTESFCRKFTKNFSRSCSALSASFSARRISRLAFATPRESRPTDKATGHNQSTGEAIGRLRPQHSASLPCIKGHTPTPASPISTFHKKPPITFRSAAFSARRFRRNVSIHSRRICHGPRASESRSDTPTSSIHTPLDYTRSAW